MTHKTASNIDCLFEYGKGKSTDHCCKFSLNDFFAGKSAYLKGVMSNYTKVCISKITYYFSNFKLNDYAVSNIVTVPESMKDVNGKFVRVPSMEHFMKLRVPQESNGLKVAASIVQVGFDFDATRGIIFYKNLTGSDVSVDVAIKDSENSKHLMLRKGLKLKTTIYCKPKKYIKTSDWVDSGVALKDLLKFQDSPDSVIHHNVHFGPSYIAGFPSKDDKDNYVVRYLTFDVVCYVKYNFSGQTSSLHE